MKKATGRCGSLDAGTFGSVSKGKRKFDQVVRPWILKRMQHCHSSTFNGVEFNMLWPSNIIYHHPTSSNVCDMFNLTTYIAVVVNENVVSRALGPLIDFN